MITVLSIIGTRPEAIKMAPVIRELRKHPMRITSRICVTAQHRQMLDQVLGLFKLTPDCDLDLMVPDQTLPELTARVLRGLEPLIRKERPDWVLLQGDTTTVMAASLVACYHQTRIGHVEAGLRTGNKHQPFPEEINRRVTDALADAYFAPTAASRDNLLREGVPADRIRLTGNTVIDALLDIGSRPYEWRQGSLAGVPTHKRLMLVTAHRRESFGKPFEELCLALRQLALTYPDTVHLVYPVHLNPRVQEPVTRILAGLPNVSLVEPLDYLTFVHLMKAATLILTDSGGVQEEAPSFGIPVLVMRETTERPEGIAAGVARLVGTSGAVIVREACRLLDDPAAYQAMARATNPYGDGHAAERIVKALLDWGSECESPILL